MLTAAATRTGKYDLARRRGVGGWRSTKGTRSAIRGMPAASTPGPMVTFTRKLTSITSALVAVSLPSCPVLEGGIDTDNITRGSQLLPADDAVSYDTEFSGGHVVGDMIVYDFLLLSRSGAVVKTG